MSCLLVIGVGNEYRRDDGAGVQAARKLAAKRLPGVVVRAGNPLGEDWQSYSRVCLVDAVVSGASPGTIHRLDGHHDRLVPESFRGSTHALGIVEAIELYRQVAALPPVLTIYGIEGLAFGEGDTLSAKVARAVDEVVTELAHLAAAEDP